MTRLFIFIALVYALALTACAGPVTVSPQGTEAEFEAELRTQKEMSITQMLEEQKHVDALAYPLLRDNASLCLDTAYTSGFFVWNKYDVPYEEHAFFASSLGLSEAPEVMYAVPGSPAAMAGLRTGDIVTAINGTSIPSGKKIHRKIEKILKDAKEAPQLHLTILRNDREIDLSVIRDRTCNYGVSYDPYDHEINASADGEYIKFTRGMYQAANNDNEFSLVIAHEIAHNMMLHNQKSQQNWENAKLAGALIDLLAAYHGVNTNGEFKRNAAELGANAYSVEFEQEADYVGMYLMARSGLDTSQVAGFWRRMSANRHLEHVRMDTTHPSDPKRFLAIEKTHQEIMAKKAAGKPLLPNLKK